MVTALRSQRVVELADLRVAGGLMLAAAAVGPFLGRPGLPCPLREVAGVPCPLCGMTTSVTDTVHLDIPAALAANPGGVVAVAMAVLLLARPRWQRASVPVWVVPLALVAMWLFELRRFGVL